MFLGTPSLIPRSLSRKTETGRGRIQGFAAKEDLPFLGVPFSHWHILTLPLSPPPAFHLPFSFLFGFLAEGTPIRGKKTLRKLSHTFGHPPPPPVSPTRTSHTHTHTHTDYNQFLFCVIVWFFNLDLRGSFSLSWLHVLFRVSFSVFIFSPDSHYFQCVYNYTFSPPLAGRHVCLSGRRPFSFPPASS